MKSMFKYQKEGFIFGVRREGKLLIGDEMGLGKTIQAIAVSFYFNKDWPLLIICPASLRVNWSIELEKWLSPWIKPQDINIIIHGKSNVNSKIYSNTPIHTSMMKKIDLQEENQINPKIVELLLKSITQNEYTKLKYDLSQTITFILRNLTIVMRNSNYNNHLNRLYLSLQNYNEKEEEEEIFLKELNLIKDIFLNLQKKKKKKFNFEEIFELEILYQKSWISFFKKNQKKFSNSICFIDSKCNFIKNRWISKMESKIKEEEVDFISNSRNKFNSILNDELKEEKEISFQKFIESKLNLEIEKGNNEEILWEKEKLFHFSEFRLNFYQYSVDEIKFKKFKNLNNKLPMI